LKRKDSFFWRGRLFFEWFFDNYQTHETVFVLCILQFQNLQIKGWVTQKLSYDFWKTLSLSVRFSPGLMSPQSSRVFSRNPSPCTNQTFCSDLSCRTLVALLPVEIGLCFVALWKNQKRFTITRFCLSYNFRIFDGYYFVTWKKFNVYSSRISYFKSKGREPEIPITTCHESWYHFLFYQKHKMNVLESNLMKESKNDLHWIIPETQTFTGYPFLEASQSSFLCLE